MFAPTEVSFYCPYCRRTITMLVVLPYLDGGPEIEIAAQTLVQREHEDMHAHVPVY